MPSRAQLVLARIDAWVLTNGLFADLRDGKISREKAVGELVGRILASPAVRERWIGLQKLSRRHRVLTRAEKLCWDESAADSLHVQARRLEVDPLVAEVDLVLQGGASFAGA